MPKRINTDTDVVDIMNKIQAQLAVLDQKLDSFMTKSLTELAQARAATIAPVRAPVQHNIRPAAAQPKARPMFRATCADCRKECELPFQPRAGRPVYCKECFTRRKSGPAKPQAQAPVPAPSASAPQAEVVKKPAVKDVKKRAKAAKAAKKPAKKPAPKKKAKKKK